jgi:hypothetical protein
MPDHKPQIKTPWHLWVIGGVSLLWNAIGAMDFTATQLRVESYLEAYTLEQLDYFFSFPVWAETTWAVAVWFSVLGSVTLLLRLRLAAPIFWVALISLGATAIYNFILSDPSMSEVAGTGAMIFSAVIFLVAVGLALYSSRMRASGVLH